MGHLNLFEYIRGEPNARRLELVMFPILTEVKSTTVDQGIFLMTGNGNRAGSPLHARGRLCSWES